MTSLLDIGLSGLTASKSAMNVVANNIANANNPFYSRREIDFIEVSPGLFGAGVRTGDVRRIVDKIANDQLMVASQDYAKYSAQQQRLSTLETFVDNDDTSVVKFINTSLTTLQGLNATPSSVQSRNQYLTQLRSTSQRMNDVSQQLTNETKQTQDAVRNDVTQINSILENLAQVNEKIASFGSQLNSQAGQLLDQQDQLLNQLSTYMNFEKQSEENGVVQLQLTNGQPLLMNNQPSKLSVKSTSVETGKIDITMKNTAGEYSVTEFITSGEIAGLMEYSTNILNQSKRDLDRLALTMTQQMNTQNKLGVDLQGNLGGLIFNDLNTPTAAANRVSSNGNNSGNANLSVFISDATQLTTSDYELRFDTSSHYELVRLSDGQVMDSANVTSIPFDVTVDGFQLKVDSASFAAGDVYTLSPTHDGASDMKVVMTDGSKLALGLPVVTEPSLTNKGSGKANLTQVIDTTNSAFSQAKKLNPPLNVEFITPTTYRLINANDGSIFEDNIAYDPSSGADVFPTPAGYDPGYRVSLSGEMQDGDSFFIQYNSDSQGDNRNGLILADLYKSGSVDGGSLNYSQAYQNISSNISTLTNSVNINLESTKILQSQAQSRRDQASGVSLEEETMNLSRYQESYMASAQVLEAMQTTMDTLFAMLRS